ncbi:CU044_5270 family protein [Kribbella sp. NPDC004536]|uniref:CU044_5270 family protein n=1 Tax=Kribbella sp. NPDC004536 TaxID=3364106 RepID=UPI0036A04529
MTPEAGLAFPSQAVVPADEDARALEASAHDPERFSAVFDKYFDQVHGYVARRLGPDVADDLAAETFLIAFRQRERFDHRHGVVRAWLYGIATNLIRRHRRDEVRALRAMAKLPAPIPAGPHEDRVAAQVTAQGASRELAAALASLNAKDREVLLLVALGQLTYAEVAAALGIAYGTVCSRLSRARRAVRASLGTAITTATALVAVTGLGGALLVGHDDAVPAGPTTTTAPRVRTAAEVLIALAVQQEKDEKVSGTYFRVRSLQVTTGKYARRTIIESWMPMKAGVASWFGWVDLDHPEPVVNKMSFRDVPPGYYLTGEKPLSAKQIAALPTDPAALRKALLTPGLSADEQDYAVFSAAGRLLFEMPSPPKLRGAALRVLAALPGTRIRTGVKDPIGRTGIEVSLTQPRTTRFAMATTYVIDPTSGRLLSSTVHGLKSGSTVVLESGWTDDRPTPPSTHIR